MTNVRELVVLARRRLDGVPPRRHAASVEGVELGLARRERRRRGWFGALASGLLGASCALCLLLANRDDALSVEVLGGGVRPTGSHECALLRFSDGSEVAIGAGSRLRIAALKAARTELQLERGSARVDVARRPGAVWRLRAGRYQLDGNGASFEIDYSPERQSLSVDLASGSLSVTGPAFQSEVAAGEHLSVELDQGRASLERRELIARCSPRDAQAERKDE